MNEAARLGSLSRRVREVSRLTGLSAWAGVLGFCRSDDLTYAASIAYYGLVSLFPFSLLAFAILGRIVTNDNARDVVQRFVLQYFPTQFDFISTQLDAFRTHTASFGVVGSVAVVWAALGVFSAITTAVDYAWGVQEMRTYWKHKLVSFVMLLVAGLILLVALLLVSASGVVGARWFEGVLREFPALVMLEGLTTRTATTVLFVLVVGLIYYFVPNVKVRFRDVWIGAVVTGLLWRVAFEALSLYIHDMTRFTRINGSIAAVVVFLLWAYVQAAILLYGVEFTAAYARLRRGRPDDVPAASAPRT